MVFKIKPEKFEELAQVFFINQNSLTFLTQVTDISNGVGAIFLKKTTLEIALEQFEQSYEEKK